MTNELEGDVLGGDVLGGMDVIGESDQVVGVVVRKPGGPARMVSPRSLRLPAKPAWRDQLAPGVPPPAEGMVPLPLEPTANGGTFTALVTQITFQGSLQKPFRPERLLTSVVRSGTSAVGRVLGQVFVGTDLQQAEISAFDVELVGQATAFGTRLTCQAAEPGVFVRVQCTLSQGLTSSDTIYASMMFLGRVMR